MRSMIVINENAGARARFTSGMHHRKRHTKSLTAWLLLACIGAFGGCTTVYPRFAYVANEISNTVSIYTVDAQTGQLRLNGYVTAGVAPHSVSTDPNARYAYVAN